MSWKTLVEKFGDLDALKDQVTSPFDFQGGPSGEDSNITVIAVPAPPTGDLKADSDGKSSGTELQMPSIPNTKTVQVHQAPDIFKGELGHLSPEEHQTIIDWFDKASIDPNTPAEVRTYLLDTVLRLKMDALKRIPNDEPVQEGLFRSALEKVGLASKPIEKTDPIKVPTDDELFSQAYPEAPYIFEYESPEIPGKWLVWKKIIFKPTRSPFGRDGEGYSYPQQWGLDKYSMALASRFPEHAKFTREGRASGKPGIKWRTIWHDKVLYKGEA